MPKRKCSKIDTSIGKRLRFYRMQAGLTQKQMADVLRLDRTTYTKYETSKSEPSAEIMGKIVRMLGVDYNAVMSSKKGGDEIDVADVDALSAAESSDSPFLNMNSLDRDERTVIASYRVLSDEKKEELQGIIEGMLSLQDCDGG